MTASLMFTNAVAILNEERFLERYGWGSTQNAGMTSPTWKNSMKGQTIGTIGAVSYLRMPLIMFNTLVIIVKILFG